VEPDLLPDPPPGDPKPEEKKPGLVVAPPMPDDDGPDTVLGSEPEPVQEAEVLEQVDHSPKEGND
jgi:hypothetical protein